MNCTISELRVFILKQIEDFSKENDMLFSELNTKTRLIGANAIFDSLGLVGFLAELEEALEEEYGVFIEIADEKAMSRVRSPFINTETLSDYLLERINEE